MTGEDAVTPPAFRVVRGDPTDEELAALTVVLTAAHTPPPDPPTPPKTHWTNRRTQLRTPLQVGGDAWRTSTWPG